MASEWYVKTKGQQVFSGLEITQSSELESVFNELLNNADNAYSVSIVRNGEVAKIITGALINSKVNSKHGEKIIAFKKGEMRIGDYIEYNDRTYLISDWVNEDITMNDSAPMHLCNAIMYFQVITKTDDGVDGLGRPKYIEHVSDLEIPIVYDTLKFYSDEDKVVNIEKDEIECWAQYNEVIDDSINNEVLIFNKPFTVRAIMRDKFVVSAVEGSTSVTTSGLIKLKIKPKE